MGGEMNTKSVGYGPKAVLEEAVDQGELQFAVGAMGNSEGQVWSHAAGNRDAKK